MNRTLKWAGGGLLILAATIGFVVWDARRRADDVLRAAERETLDLLAQLRARPATRPVFGGEPLEGNAWDLYAVHVKALADIPFEERDEIPEVAGDWEPGRVPDDEVLDVLYLKYEPHVKGIQEALRRRLLEPKVAFEEGSNAQIPLISEFIKAGRVLAGGVVHQGRMGRRRESIDLVLTGLAFSRDPRPAVVGRLVGIVVEGVLCESLFGLLGERRFMAADLERLASLLDQLDAARSAPAQAWDEEELFIRFTLLHGDYQGAASLFEIRKPGWKNLWSWKLSRAQALSSLPGYMEDVRRALALPPHALAAEAKRFQAEWPERLPPLLFLSLRSLLPALLRDVEALSLRALLRVSVGLAWYEAEHGKFPQSLAELSPRYLKTLPACPLTNTPLGYKNGVLWSRGADGVDDGGSADPEDPRLFEKAGTDVVVTLKRPK